MGGRRVRSPGMNMRAVYRRPAARAHANRGGAGENRATSRGAEPSGQQAAERRARGVAGGRQRARTVVDHAVRGDDPLERPRQHLLQRRPLSLPVLRVPPPQAADGEAAVGAHHPQHLGRHQQPAAELEQLLGHPGLGQRPERRDGRAHRVGELRQRAEQWCAERFRCSRPERRAHIREGVRKSRHREEPAGYAGYALCHRIHQQTIHGRGDVAVAGAGKAVARRQGSEVYSRSNASE